MKSTVQQLIDTRAQSKLFSRTCCCQEKTSKVISAVIIAAAMSAYAYVVISNNITKFQTQTKQAFPKQLPSLTMPGFLVCTATNNLTSGWLQNNFQTWINPSSTYNPNALSQVEYGDPRIQLLPFFDSVISATSNMECCQIAGNDFLGKCVGESITNNCGVRWSFISNKTGKFVGESQQNLPPGSAVTTWGFGLDCVNIEPGIVVKTNQDAIYLPYMIYRDYGVFAQTLSHQNMNSSANAANDPAYLFFINNWVFWPQKMIIVSYTKEEYPNSADVDPLALYLGSKDAALGGPQQRIRMDVGLGLGSIAVTHFTYTGINGLNDPTQSGWTVAYDQTLPAVPWFTNPSVWNPNRLAIKSLAYTRIRCSVTEFQTSIVSLFTVLDLITASLAIIGSSTALVALIIGPGEYNPNGIINRLFYSEVPMLKNTASDIHIKVKLSSQDNAKADSEQSKSADAH
jgi:hypothetical protein